MRYLKLTGKQVVGRAQAHPPPEIVTTTNGVNMRVKAHKLSTLSAILASAFLVTACGGGGTTGGVIAKDPSNDGVPTSGGGGSGGGASSAWVNPGRVTLTANNNGQAVRTVLVGVVDEDFVLSYAEINGLVHASKNFSGASGSTEHGTAVAQVIAGKQVGYSGNVKLLLGSTADASGYGARGDLVSPAGVWAFEQGAKVVNYSLEKMWQLGNMEYQKPVYTAALNAGGAVVVGAGNDNQAVSDLLPGPSIFDAGNVSIRDLTLVVGALGLDGTKAAYSNVAGSRTDVQQRFLVALGTNKVQPNATSTNAPEASLINFTGTSSATPVVTAAVATLSAYWPHLTGTELTGILLNTANRTFTNDYNVNTCGASGTVNCGLFKYGQGKLDLTKAMTPIGTVSIETGTRIGASSSSIQSTSITLPLAFGDAMQGKTLKTASFDSYGRDFQFNLAGRINSAKATIGMTAQAEEDRTGASGPTAVSLSFDGRGALAKASMSYQSGATGFAFAHGQRAQMDASKHGLGLARSTNTSAGAAQISSLSMSWDASRRASLVASSQFAGGTASGERHEAGVEIRPLAATSLTVGQAVTSERALLGQAGSGALAVGGSAGSASFLRMRRDLGAGWSLFGHAEMGSLQVAGSGALTALNDVRTSQYSLGLAYLGDRETFGLAVSQPLRADSAQAQFKLATGRDLAGGVKYRTETMALRPSGRQMDLDMSYKRNLSRTSNIGVHASYSHDAGHAAGVKDFGVMMKYVVGF
jgi:hypothetical protein